MEHYLLCYEVFGPHAWEGMDDLKGQMTFPFKGLNQVH